MHTKTRSLLLLLAHSLPLLAMPAAGQASPTPRLLLEEGESLIAAGTVFALGPVVATADGVWFAKVTTDNPLLGRRQRIVRQGFPVVAVGAPVAAPPLSFIRAIGSITVDPAANLLWNLTVSGPAVSPDEQVALYWNSRPLARIGQEVVPARADSSTVPPGVRWSSLGAFHPAGTGRLVVSGRYEEADRAQRDTIACIEHDDFGSVTGVEVIVAEGDAPQGFPASLRSILRRDGHLAANDRGDVLWVGKLRAAPNQDGVVVLGRDRILATEGRPAPVAGRRYSSFEQTRVDLNRAGETVFTSQLNVSSQSPDLTETAFLIVRNGAKFVQQGDVLPAVGARLGSPLRTPVKIADSGDVFWAARFADVPAERDEAFMRNGIPLIREGVTRVEGNLVSGIDREGEAFAISPDGRTFFGRVVLENVGEALVMLDLGRILPVAGCSPPEAGLRVAEGHALPGGSLAFELTGGGTGMPWVLVVTSESALGPDGCGLWTPLVELLVVGPAALVRSGNRWSEGRARVEVPLPTSVSLVDSDWMVQGFVFRGGSAGDVAATNGLDIRVGAP